MLKHKLLKENYKVIEHYPEEWRSIFIHWNLWPNGLPWEIYSSTTAQSSSEQWHGVSIQEGLWLCWYSVELMTKIVWESSGYKLSWKDYRYIWVQKSSFWCNAKAWKNMTSHNNKHLKCTNVLTLSWCWTCELGNVALKLSAGTSALYCYLA